MTPFHPLPRFISPAVMAAAALVVLACIGAVIDAPSCRAAVEPSAPATRPGESPVVQAAAHPQAVNIFSRNLQLPRAPRHRSERPSSGAVDVEAVTATVILASLDVDTRRPFVAASVRCCPLAGHPLSLLRPPSLLAG